MPDLWSHLSHHYLAIVVGLALATTCSILSVFIVLRKMAMIAESIAHAGIGGIAFPCGFSSAGLPIGLQLQAPPFEEERLLRAAHMFQQATDWHQRRPPMVA